MQTMDNAQVIRTMEKCALHAYLKTLIDAELDKVTLFRTFPQSNTLNLTEPVEYVLVKDLNKVWSLNSGKFHN